MAGAVLGLLRRSPAALLLLTFAIVSFSIAALTDIQAGGNVNYFFESMFGLIPLAVLGLTYLIELARQQPALGLFLSVFLSLTVLEPRVRELVSTLRDRVAEPVRSQNETFLHLETALRGRHFFSTVPRLALLDSQPALTEPFLVSYLERLGKFDARPIVRRVAGGEFDLVITGSEDRQWRGIRHVPRDLQTAIDAAYEPSCTMLKDVFWLPRRLTRQSGTLSADLASAGCVPVDAQQSASSGR